MPENHPDTPLPSEANTGHLATFHALHCAKEPGVFRADCAECVDADNEEPWDAGAWYCDHDVPNGCPSCAAGRRNEEMLDAMTDEERQDYLYDGGTFETYFAQGGPAWQAEERERRGEAR